jgi:proteasome lid subunit RPN8/RPN11
MLTMTQEIYDQLIDHARSGFPLEVCGILGGRQGSVEQLFPMTNTDQSNEHFMMAPAEQFAVVRQLRALGLEMSAIYHSHPETPARPSAEDIRLALTPDVFHVIISLQTPEQPEIRVFRISGGEVASEELTILSRKS